MNEININQPNLEDDCLDHECSKCNNIACKCHQIMTNLSINIDLTAQVGHDTLYNIFLTLYTLLQNLENGGEEGLVKITTTCFEIYKDLNPKEMGCVLN